MAVLGGSLILGCVLLSGGVSIFGRPDRGLEFALGMLVFVGGDALAALLMGKREEESDNGHNN